ncbi:MAG TPA: beta-L-arabinofuranosidase domain-containing protein, partial [Flavitalea sp.]|nr:beta-L-arabinofuranosidase domain-containing protein [Flavitalea sp.]
MKKFRSIIAGIFCMPLFVSAQENLVVSRPVNFSQVTITDKFWGPKLNLVEDSTLKACIYQTEIATPRLRNFEKVARKQGEKHEGIFYDDSDVFKALEAMAYSLKNRRNPELEKKADEWIDKIAAAQLPDGYLNTYFTLNDLGQRWTDMSMHEDYNGGHMIEAAVAYFDATGKRKFLDVSIKWANHFDSLFGPSKRHWVTGHQELELALVKLYRVTKDPKYLALSHWLLEERGHRYAKGYTWTDWKDTAYAQDVKPVSEQTEITGHAVRAMYMYTGAADVAALTGDRAYMNAMKAVWEDVVYRNMYITGGIGSSGGNEGFSIDYDLPNERAYCETCASVGMVFWNQRMNSLTGESKYYDVLERSLYNGALDGLSLTGTHFFYGNPLASGGQHKRREWFGTACCPANIARLVASLGNYIYAQSDKDIWVNLFVGSSTSLSLGKTTVGLAVTTNYPWEGKVTIAVDPSKKLASALHIRVPGWTGNETATGNLYTFLSPAKETVKILVNGKPAVFTMDKGYAVIDREWKKGDRVEMDLPMEIRKVASREEVSENKGRLA